MGYRKTVKRLWECTWIFGMEIKGCRKRNTKDSNLFKFDNTAEQIIKELTFTLTLLLIKSVTGYMGCEKTV